ncbi:MAG: class I SAM-dependent methyltransferase [Deltaproteobacteria bacterium]|nr:class I SAM-dependent methyltransferase [Deltaproteobacteria bacterium]
MPTLKAIAKKIPVLSAALSTLRGYQLMSKDIDQVITQIYETKAWGGAFSASGTGSDVAQTRTLVQQLPLFLRGFAISSILDIPCGEFSWMKELDRSNIDYTGADIVEAIVAANTRSYGSAGRRFVRLDLTKDPLPQADLLLCRDCLVHFSFADVFRALENLCAGEFQYVAATTFTDRTRNRDIVTGQWRALNLERPPIALPKPIYLINEGCTEDNGAYADKALGFWKTADIRVTLMNRRQPGR